MSETGERTVVLEGLDGGTPLGFLAAVGLLQVLADRAVAEDPKATLPRLSWRQLDGWRPCLHGPGSVEDVASLVHQDAQAWQEAALLQFRYVKVEKGGAKQVGGLRAPVAVLRAWLLDRRAAGDELSLSYAQALMSESASELNKKPPTAEHLRAASIPLSEDVPLEQSTERTFFDFTSRNAQFLEQVAKIRGHLTLEAIERALERGDPEPDAPCTLDWDLSSDVPASIYTGYARGFLPTHEWLAFRGLVCFPVTGLGARARTTACQGRRLRGAFLWPLWEAPAGPDTVRSLIGRMDLERLTPNERQALGISIVLRAQLTKKADGYTGTFAPPGPV